MPVLLRFYKIGNEIGKEIKGRLMKRKAHWILVAIVIGANFYFSPTSWSQQDKVEDIILNRYSEKAKMPPVVFPHSFHSNFKRCEECHEEIFIMRRGANDMTESKMIQGKYCGKCHNGMDAFSHLYCDRCHSGESKTSPKTKGIEKR